MKGVSKRVIEINEPENEDIERIVVFLKPGVKNVHIGKRKAEAEKYVSGLVSWRRLPFFKPGRIVALCFGALFAATLCGAVLLVV